jgi:hypothetical protein
MVLAAAVELEGAALSAPVGTTLSAEREAVVD